MKPKIIKAHMEVAGVYAKMSSARRLQVGAIVVKDDRIISIGYNGMPSGWDNDCEYKNYDLARDFDGNYFPYSEKEYPLIDDKGRYALKTRPEVLHAEANAIAKVARSPESAEDSVIFVTHAPCIECAKLIYQSGIKQVFYRDNYRSDAGTAFLKQAGITVNKVEE